MNAIIKHLLENNFSIYLLILILTIISIIKYQNNLIELIELIPNKKRRLNIFLELQKQQTYDETTDVFIKSKINSLIFSIATGLPRKEENLNFLNSYHLLKNKFTWKEFKPLKNYIPNSNKSELIPSKKIKCLKMCMCFWGIVFSFIFCLFFYTIWQSENLTNDDLIFLCTFTVTILLASEIIFLLERQHLITINKYNKMVSESPSGADL